LRGVALVATCGEAWRSAWEDRVAAKILEEDYQEKIERLQVTAIEGKETSKWLAALNDTVERVSSSPALRPVMVVGTAGRQFHAAFAYCSISVGGSKCP